MEQSEERRQRFEARVAEKIKEFAQLLEERAERQLRIRKMKLQIEDLQARQDDLRARLGLPRVVWPQEIELEEYNRKRWAASKARRNAWLDERHEQARLLRQEKQKEKAKQKQEAK
jgi:putative heme iron utilization protein